MTTIIIGAINAFLVRIFAIIFFVKQTHVVVANHRATGATVAAIWHALACRATRRNVGCIAGSTELTTGLYRKRVYFGEKIKNKY